MMLELHVLGPGLGLPSIDAECLAAIIYLQRSFTNHDRTQNQSSWHLIASSDFDVSPFRRLPALRVRHGSGQTDTGSDLWVAGFVNIVTYLRKTDGEAAVDLDANLSELQQADSHALMSFIQSRGGPLLDLSLYVSSENYNSCTRPALGDLLHWPESWIIPHRLREDSRRRAEHLGLSALDVDMANAQQEKEANEGLAAHIPKSLRKPRQTVSGMLGKSAQQTRFRIEAVTEDFLEPLHEKLVSFDQDRGLLGEGFHTVDCLAVAYLTLMQQPELPQAWLREILTTKYFGLSKWAKVYAQDILDSGANVAQAVTGERLGSNSLPWKAPATRTLSQTTLAVIENIVRAVPGLRFGYQSERIGTGIVHQKQSPEDKQLAYVDLRRKQILYSQVLTSIVATTSLTAWLLHAGMLPLFRTRSVATGRNFGEAGSLLGLR